MTAMSRRFVACLFGLFAFAFAFAWTVGAWAGTVSIDTTLIQRGNSNHPGQTNVNWISRADCLADDVFTFSLSTTFVPGEVLQGWVGPLGADCHFSTARTGTSATCRKVYENASPTQPGMSVQLRDQDLLAAAIAGASSTSSAVTLPATSAVCEPTSAMSTTPVGLAVYFLFITNGSVADVTAVTGDNTGTEMSYDLVGPTAPSAVSAGVGDTLLKVQWGGTSDTTLAGYYVFCVTGSFSQPYVSDAGYTCVEAGASDAATDTGAQVTETGPAEDGAAQDAGDDVVDAGDDVVDAGDTEASTTSASALGRQTTQLSTGNGGCPAGTIAVAPTTCDPTGALLGGVIPSATLLSGYLCGQASDPIAVDLTVSGLVDNKTYAVAVAAYDQLGNVGPLSNVACQTPQHVLGFYDTYTAEGGTAGGSSFCAVRAPGAKTALMMAGLLALAAAAFVLRRRR
jgi:hypothetical protein